MAKARYRWVPLQEAAFSAGCSESVMRSRVRRGHVKHRRMWGAHGGPYRVALDEDGFPVPEEGAEESIAGPGEEAESEEVDDVARDD